MKKSLVGHTNPYKKSGPGGANPFKKDGEQPASEILDGAHSVALVNKDWRNPIQQRWTRSLIKNKKKKKRRIPKRQIKEVGHGRRSLRGC